MTAQETVRGVIQTLEYLLLSETRVRNIKTMSTARKFKLSKSTECWENIIMCKLLQDWHFLTSKRIYRIHAEYSRVGLSMIFHRAVGAALFATMSQAELKLCTGKF